MMAFKSIYVIVLFVALLNKEALGFSVSPRLGVASIGSRSTSLGVGSSLPFSDEEKASLMQHAQECAVSDSCSVTDAKAFLQDLMQVQSEPAKSEDAMEIVAKLQAKIRQETATAMSQGILSASLLSSPTPLLGRLALPLGIILYLTLVVPLIAAQDAEAVPLTFQEWWWAARDGYLTTMFAHYMRNGGL